MQHSARDPKRDHDHGRIYRVTYPSRPLVKPVPIAGAPIAALFKALEEPEYRTRYRARRELRGRDAGDVMPAVKAWLASLDPNNTTLRTPPLRGALDNLGLGQIDPEILKQCLTAKSHQARAAAVDVIRFSWRKIPDHAALLQKAATDEHPRVRLAAMVAASWLDNADGARSRGRSLGTAAGLLDDRCLSRRPSSP